jgi:polysaccharide biosynthesis transport protein
MTTLPQTTGTRFPRAGGRAPSIPGPANGGSGGFQGGNTLSISDILRVLRTNALMLIALLLIALILSWVVNEQVLKRFFPAYTARAQLQVTTPQFQTLVNQFGTPTMALAPLETRLATQARRLQSVALWDQVLESDASRRALQETDWYKSFLTTDSKGAVGFNKSEAIEDAAGRLSVVEIKGTELIDLSLSTKKKDDAEKLLNEVIRVHIQNQYAETNGRQDQERTFLRNSQNFYQQIETSKKSEINALIQRGVNDAGSSGNADITRESISNLTQQLNKVISDENDAKQQLEAIQEAIAKGQVPPIADERIQSTPDVFRLKNMRNDTEINIAMLESQLGPDHRSVKDARAQLEVLARKYDAAYDEARLNAVNSIKSTLEQALKSKSAERAAMEASRNTLIAELANYNRNLGDLLRLRDELKAASEMRAVADKRLRDLEQNNDSSDVTRNTIRMASPVQSPNTLTYPNLRLTMLLGGVAGLGLGLLIAFARELMDTSIRSPRDITRVGQMNLLGMIPHEEEDPQAAGSELSLVISQAPTSMIAEQFRQVRTRLQHAASLDTTRSLLVTSPGPGDGKTTVACNIAAGLALNGRKILLVDANFRRPQIHAVFGLTNDVGFGSVLGQQASMETAVRKSNVPNLDVLTTGPRPANPTELLESALLTEFIDRALEEYDHVVFDSGPILLVSETVALAPRVDGVITVVKARANSRGLLQRMRDTLRQLKSEHLGVVLNGVRSQGGGYYGKNIKTYYSYQNAGN